MAKRAWPLCNRIDTLEVVLRSDDRNVDELCDSIRRMFTDVVIHTAAVSESHAKLICDLLHDPDRVERLTVRVEGDAVLDATPFNEYVDQSGALWPVAPMGEFGRRRRRRRRQPIPTPGFGSPVMHTVLMQCGDSIRCPYAPVGRQHPALCEAYSPTTTERSLWIECTLCTMEWSRTACVPCE